MNGPNTHHISPYEIRDPVVPFEAPRVKTIFPKFCLCLEFSNWVIILVSEHDLKTCWTYLFIFPNDGLPPLETDIGDINNGREESEEINSKYEEIRKELGFGDMVDKEDNEDLKTFIKASLEGMKKNFMQGFELFASQLGGKSTAGSSSSSPHDEKKTNGETIFSKTGPHKRPHEFKNWTRPAIPMFLESKRGSYATYDVR